jgi:hypothetical protein
MMIKPESYWEKRCYLNEQFLERAISAGTLWGNTGIKATSLGFGAAVGESNNVLFRVQGGLEW